MAGLDSCSSSLEISFSPLPGARRTLSALRVGDCFKVEESAELSLKISNINRRLLHQDIILYMTQRGSLSPAYRAGSKSHNSKNPGTLLQPPFLLRRANQADWLDPENDDSGRCQYKLPGGTEVGHLDLVFCSLSTSQHQRDWSLVLEFVGKDQTLLGRRIFPIRCVRLNRVRTTRGVKRSHSPDHDLHQELKDSHQELLALLQRCLVKIEIIQEKVSNGGSGSTTATPAIKSESSCNHVLWSMLPVS